MAKGKKTALFGGTFDPIHSGHIETALLLADALSVDEVILMPTSVPPHKLRAQMASGTDRLAMCRLAAAPYPKLTVSDLELRRGGASFTADTLAMLEKERPEDEWYLFTGADMFCTLRTWYHFPDIARRAVLCTVPRDGVDAARLRAYADALTADGARCYVARQAVTPVSSTEIRTRAAAGQPLTGLVDPAVERYIRENGLYGHDTQKGDDTMSECTTDEQYKAILRTRLSERRYHHSLCVADEARRLALRYGGDPDKAYTAGLLHDILKDTDKTSQLQILDDLGILLSDVERAAPKLWHAIAGAAFLAQILKIDDEEIVTAVRYHTTGRAGMGLLERLLFVADFTSADRDYPDVDEIRRRADISLEEAMLYGIVYTIGELTAGHLPVHPDTVAAYNDLLLHPAGRPDEG